MTLKQLFDPFNVGEFDSCNGIVLLKKNNFRSFFPYAQRLSRGDIGGRRIELLVAVSRKEDVGNRAYHIVIKGPVFLEHWNCLGNMLSVKVFKFFV
jgi:hypothetical protein